MMSKLIFWKILFHILMFQLNLIKARQNLHMNVGIAYRENGVLSNLNNLLFSMTHYNCLETKMHHVATPLWPSVGVKPNTWKSWRLGVFRDSRMFRAQQQGPKHLALECSWYHWKGLET